MTTGYFFPPVELDESPPEKKQRQLQGTLADLGCGRKASQPGGRKIGLEDRLPAAYLVPLALSASLHLM